MTGKGRWSYEQKIRTKGKLLSYDRGRFPEREVYYKDSSRDFEYDVNFNLEISSINKFKGRLKRFYYFR